MQLPFFSFPLQNAYVFIEQKKEDCNESIRQETHLHKPICPQYKQHCPAFDFPATITQNLLLVLLRDSLQAKASNI